MMTSIELPTLTKIQNDIKKKIKKFLISKIQKTNLLERI